VRGGENVVPKDINLMRIEIVAVSMMYNWHTGFRFHHAIAVLLEIKNQHRICISLLANKTPAKELLNHSTNSEAEADRNL
jgi:hypothetical protein